MTVISESQNSYEILRSGTGGTVKNKDLVTFHLNGVVKETGRRFLYSRDPWGNPLKDVAGVRKGGRTGLSRDLLGMRVGEERKITMPVNEYKVSSKLFEHNFSKFGIPNNSTLEFTLEILDVDLRYIRYIKYDRRILISIHMYNNT